MEIYLRAGTPVLIIAGAVALLAGGHGGTSLAGLITVSCLAFLTGVIVCAAAGYLVVRRRLGRAAVSQQARALPPHVYRANPDALPPRAPRAIAAPAPVVNVHLGADLLAGLLRQHAETQAVPAALVIPTGNEHDHG